ncbi:hypothetical protein P2G85_05965 [Vibrio sp. CAU 1672]|nr:hypothetical protein [Vibrio sp. CAU 1672]
MKHLLVDLEALTVRPAEHDGIMKVSWQQLRKGSQAWKLNADNLSLRIKG